MMEMSEQINELAAALSKAQANFKHVAKNKTVTDDPCTTCNGCGGIPYRHDPVGDGLGHENLFEICPDCYGDDKCPGCGALYMGLRTLPIDEFECSVCGWMYDADRHTSDYYDD